MPLPATVPVRYTEEEAGYVSVRPVVRQTFRLEELLDMVVSVAGKDVARIRQILRSGTAVYHFYRYWWAGMEAGEAELRELLEHFPDAEPSRPFRPGECSAVLLESGGQPPRHSVEVTRAAASRKRLFRSDSLWASVLRLAEAAPPRYREYSYARRADLYELDLTPEQAAALEREVARCAPRGLRAHLGRLPASSRIVFVCPRWK